MARSLTGATGGMAATDLGTASALRLAPYVASLAATWARDHPDARWLELDATCCYVDISGFTAISERLARLGRRGAEQVTEVLDGVFKRMLDVAGDKGGSLLKFGGDSLLLAFSTGDHPRLAAEAAVAMREVLRTVDAADERGSRLVLRGSMGIHTGALQLCFVGDAHRELIVFGPAASMTLRLEQEATAGLILVSEETASRLPRGATAPTAGLGRRLRWRTVVAGGPGVAPAGPLDGEALCTAVPTALRDHLTARPSGSEHRLATVAFIRFAGLDELLAQRGVDACADALESLIGTVQRAADAEGVTFLASDVDVDGGKLILVAGAPVAKEDDEGRVLRAVRKVHASPFSGLHLQTGVHRAAVFVGDVGSPTRRTYTVMGDGVNLAARLAQAAAPGAVLATGDVLDRSRSTFEVTALEPLTVKGKAGTVLAWSVGVETGVQTSRDDDLPFVGRESELLVLEGALERGWTAVVTGERGAGKTRLVVELGARAPGRTMLTLQGEPFGRATPYLPLRHVVRELLGVDELDAVEAGRQLVTSMGVWLPKELLAFAPLLAPVVGAEVDATPEVLALDERYVRRRTAEVLDEVLAVRAPEGTVLVAEDAHWFDETTAEVASHLAALAAARGWATIVTRRPAPGGFDPVAAVQLELAGLADAAARELVDVATAATPLRPRDRDALLAQAAGNPLFLGELLRFVRTSGSGALPDSLDAIAMREIDELPGTSRRVLLLASVLGRTFDRELLSGLAADEQRDEADLLGGLGSMLLEEPGGRVGFRHALLQESAYESLPFRERLDLHRRAGLALEETGTATPAALSFHFFSAEDWPRTWRYARDAAETARSSHAPGEQAEHLERVIAAGRRLDGIDAATIGSVHTELAEALVVLGEYDRADAAFASASDAQHDDVVTRARLAERRAYLRTEYLARPAAAIRQVRLGLALLEGVTGGTDADLARAALRTREADVRTRQGRLREAVRLSMAAIEECERVGDDQSLALALTLLDQGLTESGRASEATNLPRALEIYERLGETEHVAMTLSNLGSVSHYRFEWQEAASCYLRAIDAAIAAGDLATAAVAQVNLGELRVNQGAIDDAVGLLREALRTLEAFGYKVAATGTRLYLGRALVLGGDVGEGLELLAAAVSEFDAAGIAIAALDARISLAEALVHAGEPTRAQEALRDARARERALGDTSLALALERTELLYAAAIGASDPDRLAQTIARAREADARYDLLVLLRLASGGAAEDPEALERLSRELGVVAFPVR